jgi:two-component system, cell cycle response regulator
MTQKKLRILLAEGFPGEVTECLRSLFPETENNLELTVVSTVATLLSTINIVAPEVIFLDLAINPRDPLDAVRLVHRSAPGVPLIVFADPANKRLAAQSLTQGAMDFLLKGFMDARTLDRVLRAALERNTLEGLADLLRDPLTGLYTRDGFLTLGSRSQEEAHHTGGALVLLCALIENLQTLREGFGPGAANHALQDVAALLAASSRRSDLVARLGEAQFAFLAVEATGPSAPVIRQRVEKHLAALNESRSPWGPLDLRVSVGVWSAQNGRSFAEFLDAVEADLRQSAAATGQIAASQNSVLVPR